MRNRTIALLIAAAALLSAAKGELIGPRLEGADGHARYGGVGVSISEERGALKVAIGNGNGRLVVTVTREVVGSLTNCARVTLLAAVDASDESDLGGE
jgi:hypothetical protein